MQSSLEILKKRDDSLHKFLKSGFFATEDFDIMQQLKLLILQELEVNDFFISQAALISLEDSIAQLYKHLVVSFKLHLKKGVDLDKNLHAYFKNYAKGQLVVQYLTKIHYSFLSNFYETFKNFFADESLKEQLILKLSSKKFEKSALELTFSSSAFISNGLSVFKNFFVLFFSNLGFSMDLVGFKNFEDLRDFFDQALRQNEQLLLKNQENLVNFFSKKQQWDSLCAL